MRDCPRFAFAFDVSDDFFENVRVDVDTAGTNIKSVIVNNIPKYVADVIYEDAELTSLGYGDVSYDIRNIHHQEQHLNICFWKLRLSHLFPKA